MVNTVSKLCPITKLEIGFFNNLAFDLDPAFKTTERAHVIEKFQYPIGTIG